MKTHNNMIVTIMTLSLIALSMSACGSDNQSSDDREAAESASSASGVVAGGSNSGNQSGGGSLSFNSPTRTQMFASTLESLLLPANAQAQVTSCGVAAVTDSCASGVKSALYSSCFVQWSGSSYSGSVSLSYSDSGCLMNSVNDSITRTFDIVRDKVAGATIESSSNFEADYRGNQIGGGTSLVKSSDGFELNIIGVNKIRKSSSGEEIYNISHRTLSPFKVNFALGNPDGNKIVTEGELEVIHNRAKYVATYKAKDLVFNRADCCHPVSGELDGTFSGKYDGEAKLVYTGSCGTANFIKDGRTTEIQLHGCE